MGLQPVRPTYNLWARPPCTSACFARPLCCLCVGLYVYLYVYGPALQVNPTCYCYPTEVTGAHVIHDSRQKTRKTAGAIWKCACANFYTYQIIILHIDIIIRLLIILLIILLIRLWDFLTPSCCSCRTNWIICIGIATSLLPIAVPLLTMTVTQGRMSGGPFL